MKLTRRERYAVWLAGCFIGLFVVLQFVIFPFMDKRDRMKRTLETKTKSLAEIRLMKAEYDMLMRKSEAAKNRFSQRKEGFTLFSFLDQLAGETNVKERVAYMKPSKSDIKNSDYKLSSVEMKLQDVTMHQLTPYLHKVEFSDNGVYIRRMSISKSGSKEKEGFIEVILQVETLELEKQL